MTELDAAAHPMSFELVLLVAAIVLGFIQIFAAAGYATKQYGSKWNAGPRDEVMPPLVGVGGRLARARNNFLETFPFFAVAVLAAEVLGRHNGLTLVGASLYLAGRIIYVPLYAGGVFMVRSLVWGIATLGIVLVLVGLFQAA